MAYSKHPTGYPSFFHEILDLAREGRKSIKLEIPAGLEMRYRAQFYAFKRAWERVSERQEKKGKFDLAAAASANADVLMRYALLVEDGKLMLVNKDVLAESQGIRVTASEERVDDALLDQIKITEQVTSGKPIEPLAPSGSIVPEDLAKRLFGFDSTQPPTQESIDLEEFVPCEHPNGMENGCCVDCGEPLE